MRFEAGDFVRAINPFSTKLDQVETVMVTSTFALGGVLFYWVTNGIDCWNCCMVKAMPSESVKPKRRSRK